MLSDEPHIETTQSRPEILTSFKPENDHVLHVLQHPACLTMLYVHVKKLLACEDNSSGPKASGHQHYLLAAASAAATPITCCCTARDQYVLPAADKHKQSTWLWVTCTPACYAWPPSYLHYKLLLLTPAAAYWGRYKGRPRVPPLQNQHLNSVRYTKQGFGDRLGRAGVPPCCL
jgi:hypothetical protein